MLENMEDLAYAYCNEHSFNPSSALLMRKFKLNWEAANNLSSKVRLRNYKEARKLAREIEDEM